MTVEKAIIRVLWLGANPRTQSRLDLEEEVREVTAQLSAARYRDSVQFLHRPAARVFDLVHTVSDYNPHIVHFSGHGSVKGILLREDGGGTVLAQANWLRRLFSGRRVQLVVLNACHSKQQAKAISEVVNCVIGTTREVGDDAAIRFSQMFYRRLADGASIKESAQDARLLADLLEGEDVYIEYGGEALDRYLVSGGNAHSEKSAPEKGYNPVSCTANAAIYWRDGELLAPRIARARQAPLELGYGKDQSLAYLRIWPDKPLEELSGKRLLEIQGAGLLPLFGDVSGFSGYSYSRNRYGAIKYPAGDWHELVSSVQLFKSGEIWGVDALALCSEEDPGFNFLPISHFEDGLTRSLKRYLTVAFEHLSYPDVAHVEAGLVNVKDFRLAMPHTHLSRAWGQLLEDVSIKTVIRRGAPESAQAALLLIFEGVFEAAGVERPQNIPGLPAIS